MALPGLLIEYLVVGAMALLWLFPVIGIPFQSSAPLAQAVLVIPVVYVLGMFIDAAAYIIVSKFPLRKYSLKSFIKSYVLRKEEFNGIVINSGNAFLAKAGGSSKGLISAYRKSPEIVRELTSRSSRDRIARGAFINILLLWVTSKLWGPTHVEFLNSITHGTWAIITLFSIIVWMFLEIHSFSFELRLGEFLSEQKEEGDEKMNNNSEVADRSIQPG